jgi:hypothetical protein
MNEGKKMPKHSVMVPSLKNIDCQVTHIPRKVNRFRRLFSTNFCKITKIKIPAADSKLIWPER